MAGSRELERWKDEIRRGIQEQRDFGRSDQWTTWENYYNCQPAKNEQEAKNILPVHQMFALIRAMIPRTYFRNPRVAPIPLRAGLDAHAQVLEQVDASLIQSMGVKAQLKRILLDMALYGIGIIKIGYDSEFSTSPEMFRVYAEAVAKQHGVTFAQMRNIAKDRGIDIPSGKTLIAEGESMVGFGKKGQRIEYNSMIRAGMPWAMRIHPRDFVAEPGCEDIKKAQWVAHRFLRKLKDAKQDESYQNTSNLKASHMDEFKDRDAARLIRAATIAQKDADPKSLRPQPTPEDEYTEFWEIRDVKSGKLFLLNMDHDRFIRNVHDVLQIDGLPFETMCPNPRPKTFWGIPDAEVMYPQQLELNSIRKLQQDYRRGNVRRFIAEDGVFDQSEMEKFFDEKAEAYIKVNPGGKPLSDRMTVLQNNMPQDLVMWGEVQRQDMREAQGMGRNQAGEYQPGRHTATEAATVQQNTMIRTDERRDQVADVLKGIVKKTNQIIFRFWTLDDVVKVTGPESTPYWVRYTGKELQGDYDYEIHADDAVVQSQQVRQQQAISLLQYLAPYAQAGLIDPQKVLAYVMRQFPGVHIQDFMPQQAQPQARGPMGIDQFQQDSAKVQAQADNQRALAQQGMTA